MSKNYAIALTVGLLAVSHAAKPQQSRSLTAPPANSVLYGVDPTQSEVRLLVYHGGNRGHDHVIVSRNVAGKVQYSGDAETSSFTLTIPVMDFDVDDPHARSEEGGDEFTKQFSAADRSKIKEHMLGAQLLDGSAFPQIILKSTSVTSTPTGLTANLAVTVAGHQSTVVAPFLLNTSTGRLSATGSLRLRQTDLGLKPLSFFMGMFTVQDEIAIKFTIVALAPGGQ